MRKERIDGVLLGAYYVLMMSSECSRLPLCS